MDTLCVCPCVCPAERLGGTEGVQDTEMLSQPEAMSCGPPKEGEGGVNSSDNEGQDEEMRGQERTYEL